MGYSPFCVRYVTSFAFILKFQRAAPLGHEGYCKPSNVEIDKLVNGLSPFFRLVKEI